MDLDFLKKDERMPIELRALYESYGYKRYRMGSFEPYDLYMENKQFLKSEGVITFTDATGRLMALKPDVTMSLAKNAGAYSRYYYNENVYRIERRGEEYREINQMGIEFFGADAGYAQAEVVSLALDTLKIAGGEFVLDLSHMGFISGLLAALGLDNGNSEAVLSALKSKSASTLNDFAEKAGIGGRERGILADVLSFRDTLEHGVMKVRDLAISPEMEAAADELDILRKALSATGKLDSVYLDFSVVNDIDYYNGLVFRGYVKGLPRAVLAGGRYDSLMRRFGKDQKAIGFALYLDELDRFMYENSTAGETLLIYGDTDPARVAVTVRELIREGASIRAEKEMPAAHSAKRVLVLADNNLTELKGMY